MALKGNRGEWSEIYTFLKLLADGKLNAADSNLNAIKGVFYPLLQIIRDENGLSKKHYILNGDIKVIDGNTNKLIIKISKNDFLIKSKVLLQEIKNTKGNSFSVPKLDMFLNKIKINTLTENKKQKADITLVVHDLKTGLNPTLGFSIKSLIGDDATLFNAGNTTNFIYKIRNVKLSNTDIEYINKINKKPKISNRIMHLIKIGALFEFLDIESENLRLNLELIDSQLPEILGFMLLNNYKSSLHSMKKGLSLIAKENPLNYNISKGHLFYEYKVKSFLTDSALGMTPATLWNGIYDANGGIILVKDNGDLFCYHIYNKNEFQEYLVNNTRFEQASTTRYNFGSVYENKGQYFIKLNLQIRFQ